MQLVSVFFFSNQKKNAHKISIIWSPASENSVDRNNKRWTVHRLESKLGKLAASSKIFYIKSSSNGRFLPLRFILLAFRWQTLCERHHIFKVYLKNGRKSHSVRFEMFQWYWKWTQGIMGITMDSNVDAHSTIRSNSRFNFGVPKRCCTIHSRANRKTLRTSAHMHSAPTTMKGCPFHSAR